MPAAHFVNKIEKQLVKYLIVSIKYILLNCWALPHLKDGVLEWGQ